MLCGGCGSVVSLLWAFSFQDPGWRRNLYKGQAVLMAEGRSTEETEPTHATALKICTSTRPTSYSLIFHRQRKSHGQIWWPTSQVCPGVIIGLPGCGTFSFKTRKVPNKPCLVNHPTWPKAKVNRAGKYTPQKDVGWQFQTKIQYTIDLNKLFHRQNENQI